MNWYMRGVRNQITACVNYRTTEIKPFFDIYRPRRVGQRRAHLVGGTPATSVSKLRSHSPAQ